MVTIFNTSPNAIVITILVIVYLMTAAVTLFNTKLIQAKRNGNLLPGYQMLPSWVVLLAWLKWLALLTILLLSYKIALAALVIKFVLTILSVLDILGSILISPFTKSNG